MTIETFPIGEHEIQFDLDPSVVSDNGIMWYKSQNNYPCEPELIHLMTKVLKRGDRFIDGGANVGFFSLYAAKLVGPTGRVLAVEPEKRNLERLERNIAINALDNIEIVERALADTTAENTFLRLSEDNGMHSLLAVPDRATGKEQQATTIRLDTLLTGLPVRLIKLDVEGAEVAALKGGATYVRPHSTPFVVCEMNEEALLNAGTSSPEMRRLMQVRGYDAFVIHQSGALPTLVPSTCTIVPERQNSLILFSTPTDVGRAWLEVRI